MKTNKTIRSMAAMVVILFAVAATSCKKETEIVPADAAASVSFKPKSIVTTQEGVAGVIRLQTYEYDTLNKLTKFVSVSGSTNDSLFLIPDGFGFLRKVRGATQSKELLNFNTDKSLKQLSVSRSGGAITLLPVFTAFPGSPNTLTALADATIRIGFSYQDNNLRSININSESVGYTYYNDLRFQKGINELQVESTALLYHKLAEQENMTNYSLFSKLIRTVTAADGGIVRRIDTYSYVQDTHGRVTTIFMTTDFPSSGAPSQRFQHTITY